MPLKDQMVNHACRRKSEQRVPERVQDSPYTPPTAVLLLAAIGLSYQPTLVPLLELLKLFVLR